MSTFSMLSSYVICGIDIVSGIAIILWVQNSINPIKVRLILFMKHTDMHYVLRHATQEATTIHFSVSCVIRPSINELQ